MGEGSAIVILESAEHAAARGATPLAEIAGYGSTADAYRITDMHPEGAGRSRHAGCSERSQHRPPSLHWAASITSRPTAQAPVKTTASKPWRSSAFGDHASTGSGEQCQKHVGPSHLRSRRSRTCGGVQVLRHGMLPPTANLTDQDPAGS